MIKVSNGNFSKASAENPQSDLGETYHIRCKPGDIAPNVLLSGSPERTLMIASTFFDKGWQEKAFNRGLRTCTGTYQGIPVTAATSGMGCSSLGIVIRELHELGAKKIIRVGSCGTIQEEIDLGDVIISTAAVRLDGASKNWVVPEYPAVADWQVIAALVKSAQLLNLPYHVGITASTDDFYEGQGRPGPDGFVCERMINLYKELQRAKVLNFEMESSALFIYCSIHGLKAGTICAVFANRPRNSFIGNEEKKESELRCAKIALDAIKILHENDGDKNPSINKGGL